MYTSSPLIGRSLALLLLLHIPVLAPSAGAQENLSELKSPVCEVPGLTVAPPPPWYSVPIDSQDEVVEGCQLIWEEGEQYMGIMRLVSFDLRQRPQDMQAQWSSFAVSFESMIMEEMGFTVALDEPPLWSKDPVPVSGDGFSGGKAIAFNAKLAGVAHQNEAHFVVFQNKTHKYIIFLLTPAETVDAGTYIANTGAMGTLMRTLQPR
jgi:hypothetical protein